MLDRDRYEPDPCMGHFPNPCFEEYLMHIAGPYPFRHLFSSHVKEINRQSNIQSNFIFATLLVSSLPVIFYKRIYWFRNYTSRIQRAVIGLGFILVPSNIVGLMFQMRTNQQLQVKYQLNRERFQKMLEMGDISITNPEIDWAEY